MQFEVPQFIEIEDKIFGPLTWRQFVYLGGGVGVIVILYLTLPLIIMIILAIPVAALTFALSFYPINNRPFSYLIEAIYSYLTSNRFYQWRQERNIVYKSKFTPSAVPPGAAPAPAAPRNNLQGKNINSLARRLELEAMQKPKT